MRKTSISIVVAAVFALGGCAGLGGPPPAVGDSADTVKLKLGQPTSSYSAGPEQLLEYANGPMGQTTYMARIGADGRLTAFEQVLTGEKFATIMVGTATRDDVLHTIGRPAERSYLPLRDFEVWSYRYKESGVWNSMMHVHFDRGGVVRMMQNGPDPMYEEKRFFR
ncbi:hypothetical protein [Massilia psychrophila]|uniref:Lipoprotein SmpA/OmlA domain-containing protein n=1 Tax=Massilia psychrophila TaxID=1603353 RepID=A0A2G8SX61_9BURK|nr:hypothetical protein [Massilia psychrophila]PIL38386.1 hypothetical protein CR103_18170 [Massilia psychrophila]GGE81680.1 lipoprotein [Massilia psychrophila]